MPRRSQLFSFISKWLTSDKPRICCPNLQRSRWLPKPCAGGAIAKPRLAGEGFIVRGDTMTARQTEWPAMVAGCRSYGKCRLKRIAVQF